MSAALLLTWAYATHGETPAPPPLPAGAVLAFSEDWSDPAIDSDVWYPLRKRWGDGNNGVVPENIRIARDTVDGEKRNVLVCEAHGDRYDGDVVGWQGNRTRVGGVLVTRRFFASGRFEVVMKIGRPTGVAPAHADLRVPIGAVPAIWTYAYRYVAVPSEDAARFSAAEPLYNPHMRVYGSGNEYWSEIDFPELGKGGDFTRGLFNTFCQNRHDWRTCVVPALDDLAYHTFTMDWRTELVPLSDVTDSQVAEADDRFWVADRSVPFEAYLGNPLKRLGPDRYAVCRGAVVRYWVDGVQVGENRRNIPVMAAQLNLGVWLPGWGGPAPWQTAEVSFARVRIWLYADPGDVRGVLTDDITNNFDGEGAPLSQTSP